jgi:hypothetical protein
VTAKYRHQSSEQKFAFPMAPSGKAQIPMAPSDKQKSQNSDGAIGQNIKWRREN